MNRTLLDEARRNAIYVKRNKEKINKQLDESLKIAKAPRPKRQPINHMVLVEKNKAYVGDIQQTIKQFKGDNNMTNTFNEYELYVNGKLSSKDFEDYQQVRTVSMQEQYANILV
ncbi:hypothetical protein [Macrococcus animalis]|uniref:hypothetical protein n=1 Tax=Macrococcus animalis TaxID=3395467 RepID=UPI0039BDDEBE